MGKRVFLIYPRKIKRSRAAKVSGALKARALVSMKTYLCSYTYKGVRYSFEIQADSIKDADDRLYAITRFGIVDGELKATIPVPSFLERLATWFHTR